MKINVAVINTGVYQNVPGYEYEDEQGIHLALRCTHENASIDVKSFDYAGTHTNGGVVGTEYQTVVDCPDCELSDVEAEELMERLS